MATVMVTGGSGYIASWIVKKLLEGGHTVHATVRDKSREDKVGHLREMGEQHDDRLKFFEADLLEPGSFHPAAMDADIILHTASPFIAQNIKNPEETLIKPALEGTRNVLDAASNSPNVKRVVLTSSIAAIMGDATEIQHYDTDVFTEDAWNKNSSADYQPYQYSKTIAEKEAWKIADQQEQWDLVVINPGFVLGPALSGRSDGASASFIQDFGSGRYKMGVPDLYFGIVDVREVAEAHLLAAFNDRAEGRHITAADTLSILEMGKLLDKHFPNYPLPSRSLPSWLLWLLGPLFGLERKFLSRNNGKAFEVDNSKSKELGLSYRPIETTLKEHFEQLLEDGLIKKRA